MWLVRLLIRYPRPCARGRNRLSVGPSSTYALETQSMPLSRPAMWSALAMALARTLPTVSLAACGANCSTACAWSAGSPRIRSTTRRAFIGVTRTDRALALASIGVFPSSGLSPAAPVFLDVAAEGPRGSELSELVPHHRLRARPRE